MFGRERVNNVGLGFITFQEVNELKNIHFAFRNEECINEERGREYPFE